MSCNNKATDEMNLYGGYIQIHEGTYHTYDITSYLYVDILMGIANRIGLSFGYFNFFTFLPSFLLIDYSLKKLIRNPSMVYLLFLLTSIFLDTTLARQFIAMSFVLYGITFLLQKKQSITKFIIFVCIGSLFHLSMLVFLLLLLDKLKINRKQFNVLIIFTAFFFLLFTLIGGKRIPVVSSFLTLLNSTKVNYGSSGGVEYGYLYTMFLWMIMYMTVSIIRRKSRYIIKEDDLEIVNNILTMIAISFVFISFSTMTLVHSRLFRPISWLVFIVIAKWIENKKSFKIINIEVFLISIIFLYSYSYIYNRIIFSYSITIEPVENGIPFWDDDYSKMPWPK